MSALPQLRDDLRRGWNLPGDQFAITFSEHAVERYRERLQRPLSREAIRTQLSAMLRSGTVTFKPPDGATGPRSRYQAVAWLLLGDLVFPLRHGAGEGELIATSAIALGSMSKAKRARRNARNADKRARRKGTGSRKGSLSPKPRTDPDADEWEGAF